MTQPIPPTLLALLGKRALALGAGLLVVGGGARLATDEVRLAGATREATALSQRLEQQGADARRAARLELDLAIARQDHGRAAEVVAGLEARVGEARAAVASLEAERDRVAAMAASATATAEERALELQRVSQELAARGQALSAVEQELTSAREAARALQADLAARQAALDEALARARTLEGDLRREQGLAREQREALARLSDRLGEAEAALADAEARARRDAARLELVARAGVNLARLTGERPMPDVRTTVMQVDAEALPPVVVVDAGATRGLERGDALAIIRDGQEVARLEIDETSGPYASGRIVWAKRGVRVRPGDQAVTRAGGR